MYNNLPLPWSVSVVLVFVAVADDVSDVSFSGRTWAGAQPVVSLEGSVLISELMRVAGLGREGD